MVKNLPANAGDAWGLIPGLGISPGEENGNPLHYSYLENPHGQRNLAGYSPMSLKELDMTEQLTTVQHMFLTVFGQIVLKKQSLQSLSSI